MRFAPQDDQDGAGYRLWAGLLAASLVGVAVWRWFASGPPSGGDGFQYLSHALALAEGRPYGDIGYLYSPLAWTVGPPTYPPGLPLTLAPLLAVFGPASEASRWLMHGFLLAFLLLVGRYFSRDNHPVVTWGTVALVATAFLLNDRPNVIGSDLGLCAFVWGVLVLADTPGAWGRGRTLAISLLGCAALLFRVAAAPLVAAGVLLLLVHRERRWRAVFPTTLWLGTLLLVALRFGPGEDPARTMAAGAGDGGGVGGVGRGGLAMLSWTLERLDTKLFRYRLGVTEAFLYPFPFDLANDLYHLAALGIAGVGMWIWLRGHATAFSVLFAAMTVLMLAVAPVWQPRYLWVLTPFLAYGFLNGVRTLASRVAASRFDASPASEGAASRAGPRAAMIVTTVVIGLSIVTGVLMPPTTLPPERETWERVADTLRGLPNSPVRVASNRPRKVTWYTRVPAMPVVERDLTGFRAEAERLGATHVVYTPTWDGIGLPESFQVWMRDNPGLFIPIAEIGLVQVFEIAGAEER